MAKETIVRITDDLDGSAAEKTLHFTWEGVSYGIDLNAENAAAFSAAVAPYVRAARRVAGKGRRAAAKPVAVASATTGNQPKLDRAAVKEWSDANNYSMPARGRIPNATAEAYRAAQESVAQESVAQESVAQESEAQESAAQESVAESVAVGGAKTTKGRQPRKVAARKAQQVVAAAGIAPLPVVTAEVVPSDQKKIRARRSPAKRST